MLSREEKREPGNSHNGGMSGVIYLRGKGKKQKGRGRSELETQALVLGRQLAMDS